MAMSFPRSLGTFLFNDGLEQLRNGPVYQMISGEDADVSCLSPERRLAIEHCLGIIQGTRTYAELAERLGPEGDLARAIAVVPAGAIPAGDQLRRVISDLVWRRGVREGRETFDGDALGRWFARRLGRHVTLLPRRGNPERERRTLAG